MRSSGCILAMMVLVSACHGARDTVPSHDLSANPPADLTGVGGTVVSTPPRWDAAIGTLVALPEQDGGDVKLLTRDAPRGADISAELFTHDDRTQRAILHPGSSRDCGWTRASLAAGATEGGTGQWTLALAPGIATPLTVDAIADLSPRDSTDVAVRVSRLVNAIGEDSASAPFRGLPVVVRDAWRVRLPDGTAVMVAVAARSLNMESNPRSEVVTLVMEPESPAPNSAWRSAFTRRDAGPEDHAEGTDLLAGLLLEGGTPVLALLRETERGPVVDFIERAAPMTWRLRWTTASSSCDR